MAHYFSSDYLIVYGFLFVIAVVGWRAGRGITNMKEYALGSRTFGTAALVLTFLTTEVGGQGTVNLAGEIGTMGIIVLLIFLSFPVSYIVQALWLAPKIAHFKQCLTMGDVMRTLYGSSTQVVVGIVNFITSICVASAEIIMLGVVTHSLLGLDARFGIIVGGLLLTLYVVHGGMRAVTTTDVLKFLVLLVLLPVLAATALQQVGGIKAALSQIPQDQLRLWDHPRFSYYLVFFLSFGLFHHNMMDPALIQRMLMAQSGQQLRRMFLTLAGLFTVILLVFAVLGTIGHQLYPTLAAVDLIPQMIKTLLPEGLRGLMIAGIIAVVMASACSYLHAAGVTLVHDVLQPLGIHKSFFIREMYWVRYVTLLAGLLIIGLGITYSENIYGLIFAHIQFAGPSLVFPFFGGLLGLKAEPRAFYVSVMVTLLTFMVGKLLNKLGFCEAYSHFLTLICVLASGITFFVMHWVQHRGFVVVRRNTEATEEETDEYLWQPSRQRIREALWQMLPTPRRMLRYSQAQVAKYGAPYLLFGAFCCINFTLPYFMWVHDSAESYNLMLYLRVVGVVLCGLLIVRDKWPSWSLVYLPTFWHLTLLYCLPFMSTVMFLLTQGSVEWLINVAIMIMFLIVLVDWLSFILLSSLGVGLGLLFYLLAVGPLTLRLDFSTGYLLVYTCLFATLVALVFARRREQYLAAKLREIEEHYHAILAPTKAYSMPSIWRIAGMIDQHVQEIAAFYHPSAHTSGAALHAGEPSTAPDFLQYFFSTALEVIQQGKQLTQNLVQVLMEDFITPNASLFSLKACVNTILEAYVKRHLQHVQVEPSEDYQVTVSFQHLQYVMVHVLRFLHAHDLGGRISVQITQQVGIRLRLSGRALPAALVRELFTLFSPQTITRNSGLAISRLLMEAHRGRLLYKTHDLPSDPYTDFIIAFPTSEEVFSTSMDDVV